MVREEAQTGFQITRMQTIIMQWDYFKLTEYETEGSASPLGAVPKKFDSIEEYLSVFGPLVLEECTAQIIRGQAEDGESRSHVGVVLHFEKTHEFHYAKVAVDMRHVRHYSENDLGARGAGGTLHRVDGVVGTSVRVRFFLPDNPVQDPVDNTGLLGGEQSGAKSRLVRKELQESANDVTKENSGWFLTKLCNMSTILREWLALNSIKSFPFKDVIINPQKRIDPNIAAREAPPALMAKLKSSHNQYQLESITSALEQKPINLIQGPPGTGKTRTILGLLSVLLQSFSEDSVAATSSAAAAKALVRPTLTAADKQRNWTRASPWMTDGGNPRDAPLRMLGKNEFAEYWAQPERPRVLGEKTRHKPHVLVCAPSNSALDEIVHRVITFGLTDLNGNRYTPSIVRIGVKCHHSVSSVSMDSLVAQ
eukprot:gene17674-21055_t